ncbi:pyroglutamyl-peptidase I family protein [Amorphus orientalis]|uniref:pyroglutamyl-peptidase I family protein n=1 Tax=Amorphus orientalis TaxID=649198 RepID=UPI003520C3C3
MRPRPAHAKGKSPRLPRRTRPAGPLRVLITGFGPFPGVPVNPTERIAARVAHDLARQDRRIDVATEILPTEWAMLAGLPRRLDAHDPDLVVMTGVATNARGIRIERTAHPSAGRSLRDAVGARPKMTWKREPHGASRRTPVDVPALVARLNRAGVGIALSDDPGRYLCNAAYLTALDWAAHHRRPRPPVLFVHVPPPKLRTGAREPDLAGAVIRLVAEVLNAPGSGALRRPISGRCAGRRGNVSASGASGLPGRRRRNRARRS